MSILAIGQSSFLAQEVKKQEISPKISKDWDFLGHKDALNPDHWSENVKIVIGFACDPKVAEGEFSDFDHQLAQLAKEVGAAYIMLSSRTVYGVPPEPAVLKEDQAPFPDITPYGQAKREIEEDLLDNFNNVTILRLANVFGFEYGGEARRSTFFGRMLKTLREEGRITLDINPETKRDFLPVEVFVKYLGTIVQNPKPGIFNVGSGTAVSVGDIARWVIEGRGRGEVVANQGEITDGFVLDMDKTYAAYPLSPVDPDVIYEHCVAIGKKSLPE